MIITIKSNDIKQLGYTYTCLQPIGRNFHIDFLPDLTPQQMLKLGIFGGAYFEGNHQEFPVSWFKNARVSNEYDAEINFFGVKASQPLQVWEAKGWIYQDDPRGWFQWYCRYYLGRRVQHEDVRQIKRWKAMRRHVQQLQKNCVKGDWLCRRRQRQALLHWAYDSRKL